MIMSMEIGIFACATFLVPYFLRIRLVDEFVVVVGNLRGHFPEINDR